ncbi:pro-melanin-concentrating hormone, like [Centropristis striata]|uniref:pro-melanin-concentrating hormone, like n=1 Tax=Centropristis striata TaxID=184440 RepID=UPI0027DF4757|nr:pro-melanin-concentrating hormone, like [Centropristis striata]
MRQSLVCVLFSAALLLERSSLSEALPVVKADDGSLEQDAFASLLGDEAAESGVLGEAELKSSRGPRVFVIADPGVWRDLRPLHGGLSLYKRRTDDNSQVVEHRDQDLNIPILRRDTMRCMVGRVYRPCWEV